MAKKKQEDNLGDLYAILNVHPKANNNVINAAYEVLRKENPSDKVDEAYKVLSDEKSRKEYDKELRGDGKRIGNYRVIEKISEGGFAETYKAEHIDLGTLVCIKHNLNISAEDAEVLKEEAKAIWDLKHYALPAMRDLIELPDKSLALVMSYIPGLTLEQIVDKYGGLAPEHVAWIAARALDALRYIHYRGVVHGDIKPQNIIVQPEEHTAVLVDYGLAAVKPGRKDKPLGYTPLFASPEHLAGLPLIPETDLYCLGLTMIYALGGDVKKRKVPANTPEPLTDFIRRLIVHDVNSRPSWENEDVLETLMKVREQSFGRRQSGLLKLE